MIGNRIITRGMGPTRIDPATGLPVPGRAGMVTQGYGGLFRKVAETVEAVVRLGRSGTKRALRELEEVIVWAKLIRVNDEKPKQEVKGFIRLKVDTARHIAVNLVEGITTRVRSALEDIRITIKRIK